MTTGLAAPLPPITEFPGSGGGGGGGVTEGQVNTIVNSAVAGLVDSAPTTLDTLNELAAALGDDPHLATTLTTLIGGKQPLDSDLTAIASLTTTPFGRGLLTQANQAALQGDIGLVIGTDVQAHDSDLDAIAALATTSFGRSFLALADVAGLVTATGVLIKTDNLAGLADVGTSRHNLNLPSLSSALAVATTNVASLSGTTTIDLQPLVANDRVLLTAQTSGSQNGPWLIQAGGWTRPTDYPAAGAIPRGRLIEVNGGALNYGTVWALQTNTAVTIDSTPTTWQRVDVAAKSPGPGAPLQLRLPQLAKSGWYDRLAAEDVDIIVIGDSISSLGGNSDSLSEAGTNPWPWRTYKYVNERSRLTRAASPSRGIWQGPMFGGATFAPVITSTTGTGSQLSGAANWSVSLADTQVAVLTGHFTRVAVVWTQQVNGGTLTCKDETTNPLTPVAGGDGISGTTINTAGASQKFSRITYYDMTGGFALHTFTATASTTGGKVAPLIEQIVPLYGNNMGTGGVRMWPCTHTGYTTTLANNDGVGTGRGFCLDLIERLNALNPGKLLVVDNMGFNDIEANVATDKAALYASIAAISATIPIVTMVPWTPAVTKADAFKTAARAAGFDSVDPSTFIGNGGTNVDGSSLTIDGVHPTAKGSQLLSDVASAAITGDVLGVLMTMMMRDVRSMNPVTVTIGDNARAILGTNGLAVSGTTLMANTLTVDSSLGGNSSGTGTIGVVFGFPLWTQTKSTTNVLDAQPQLQIMPSTTAGLLSITSSGPAIVAGVGGSTTPAVSLVLDSTGVWKFNQALLVGAATAGGHAVNRDTGDLRFPHTLFDHFADVGSATTTETTLETDTIAAAQLSVNGQSIEFAYSGKYASAVTKDIRLKFAGTTLLDTGALTITTGSWGVKGVIQRVSATVIRWEATYTSDSSTAADRSVFKQGEVTGLTLANTAVIAVTGQAGTGGANNDIVAQRGKVKFAP